MVSNIKKAIVFKMSPIVAGNLLWQLGMAQKYIRAFEGVDSIAYVENEAFITAVRQCLHEYTGERQIVVTVRLPQRNPVIGDTQGRMVGV